jgi:RNA polymerase sigma-70 factor, ECF subfamily
MDRRPDPFEQFFREHWCWVIHRAERIVGPRDAEDVAQEVFVSLALAHERGHFDLSTPALAYLRTSTYRAARDYQRRLLREQPAAHDKDINPMDETLRGNPERAFAVRRQWDEVDALLETLPPERRIVWVMTEIDKMTLAEIAGVLDISPNTVNKRLQLARADFEAALARKRAVENRKLGRAGALLLLPLDADAIMRMARDLPVHDVSTSTRERLWRGIQKELARRRARAIGSRLKSEASHFAAIALGTVVGLLAAMALADTHRVRPMAADPPSEPVAPGPAALVAPAVVDSVGAAFMESMSTPPPLTGSSEPELTEVNLVKRAGEALEPPRPNPEESLRLLDRYAQQYPQSRRFADLVARLRRDARRLVEQKR